MAIGVVDQCKLLPSSQRQCFFHASASFLPMVALNLNSIIPEKCKKAHKTVFYEPFTFFDKLLAERGCGTSLRNIVNQGIRHGIRTGAPNFHLKRF